MDKNAPQLVDQLRAIVGEDGVVSKPEELLVYECDAYTLEKNLPNAVVLPRTTDREVRFRIEWHDPAPRTIEIEMSGSRSASSSTSNTSARRRLFSALRFSGRFSVMRRTRGRGSSTRMC